MKKIKTIKIVPTKIIKFATNISGMTIEHLINSLLDAEDKNNETQLFQLKNKSQLRYIGELPSKIHNIPIIMNNDGTITALNDIDKKIVNDVNEVTEIIKTEIRPLIEYIKHDIFDDKHIMSQELIINEKDNVLAKCDLSTKDKVLEIKGYSVDVEKIKYQLYYEANGRDIYILQTFWKTNLKQGLEFVIYKVIPSTGDKKSAVSQDRIMKRQRQIINRINKKEIEVLEYIDINNGIKLRCKKCGMEWSIKYKKTNEKIKCIYCNNKKIVQQLKKTTPEEKNRMKQIIYQERITEKSNGKLLVINYNGSREYLSVGCTICGNVWKIRADHLLERPYCPKCKLSNEN